MSDDLLQDGLYLPAAVIGVLQMIRSNIKDAHNDPSTSPEAKALLDNAYTALQSTTNGLCHMARNQLLGSTGDSLTTPVVRELTDADVTHL